MLRFSFYLNLSLPGRWREKEQGKEQRNWRHNWNLSEDFFPLRISITLVIYSLVWAVVSFYKFTTFQILSCFFMWPQKNEISKFRSTHFAKKNYGVVNRHNYGEFSKLTQGICEPAGARGRVRVWKEVRRFHRQVASICMHVLADFSKTLSNFGPPLNEIYASKSHRQILISLVGFRPCLFCLQIQI